MEENNNNEQKAGEKIKEVAKGEAKKLGKKATQKILKLAAPVISGAVLILLALGLLNMIPFLIQQEYEQLLSVFNATSENAEASNTSESIVYINDTPQGFGEYKLKVTDFAKKMLEELDNKKVSNEAFGFLTENTENITVDVDPVKEELTNMIEKYIKAEVQTTFPKTEVPQNEVDGKIKIYRASADYEGENQQPIQLKYKPYSAFKYETGTDALKYFSIEPETFKLWIAVKGSGPDDITLKPFDYQTVIQGYSVPLNFFIALHVMSQDVEFMNEFVDMVLGDGIELTYVESKSEIITETTYSGNITTEVIRVPGKGNDKFTEIEAGMPRVEELYEDPVTISNTNVSSYLSYEPKLKTVETRYSGKFYVTKADTWIKSSSKDIGQLKTETRPASEENINVRNDSYEYNPITAIDLLDNIVTVKKTKYYYIDETTTTTITESKYTVVDGENKIKITEDEGIISLINAHPKAKNNLCSAPNMLFYWLQQNENTQTHEKIMRYVMAVLNNMDYGVAEGDIDNLINDMFNEYSTGGYGNSIEAKVWFALRAADFSVEATAGIMGNIEAESGFNPSLNEEGNGIGYGLCQWSFGRRTQLEDYAASKGVAPSDVETQIEFLIAEMTVEDVDGNAAEEYADYQFSNISDEQTLRNAETPEDAAEIFCWQFERPDENYAHIDRRRTSARSYYEYYTGIGDANELQLVIVDVIKNPDKYEDINAEVNECLLWTSRVYTVAANAIGVEDTNRSANCASCSGYLYGVSTDFSNIPLGAAVYRSSSTQGDGAGYKFGHVGIYIGEGQIAHNANGVHPGQPASICTVEEWLANAERMGASVCWGWQGVPVNENYPVTQGLIPTGWGSNYCQ